MEPGATLRYTGSRPRRRSLESLIKEAALLSNHGSNEDTTRHSAQSVEEDVASSSSEISSSSVLSESSSSSSSASEELHVEVAPPNAPALFPAADDLEQDFRSAFLPHDDSSPSASAPLPSIEDVYGQLQTILGDLSIIRRQLEKQPHPDTAAEARAVRAGSAAVELGRQAVSQFSDKLRLTPSPSEFKESHAQQLALLSKMRAAVQTREPSLDQIHSIYGGTAVGHMTTAATTFPSPTPKERSGREPPGSAATIDEYFYGQSATPTAVALPECQRCGRHFGSSANLAHHEKLCTGAAASPPSFSGSDQGSASTRHACRHCGRLMTAKGLTHHENICIRIFHGRRRAS